MLSRQSRGLGVGSLLLSIVCSAVHCDNSYPIAPTRCDDYCLARQRADCEEDFPEKCVSTCENTLSPTLHVDCEDPFDRLVRCYEQSDASDFFCDEDGLSRPREGICIVERRGLQICTDPIGARCDDYCVARGETCAESNLEECFSECQHAADVCNDETVDFLSCSLAGIPCDLAQGFCAEEAAAMSQCVAQNALE